MPTYEYRREDGSVFEIDQSIKADALEICPTTGQKVTRLISGGTGLIFKGTGFYLTDYARQNTSATDGSSEAKDGDSKAMEPSSKESSGKSEVAAAPEKPSPGTGSAKSE